MILSVYFTDYWYSFVLFDPDSVQVVTHKVSNLPYNPNKFYQNVTTKRLAALLKEELGEEEYDKSQKVTISQYNNYNDISCTYVLDQILAQIPFTAITLDHYSGDVRQYLSQEELNYYMNSKFYNQDLSFSIKSKIDYFNIKLHVQNNLQYYIGQENVVVLTHGIKSEKRQTYVDNLVRFYSDNLKIGGIWKFSLDDKFAIVPLMGALLSQNQNITDFFAKTPLHSDAKLITAPEVTEYEYSNDANEKGKGSFSKSTFEKDKINHLDIDTGEAIYLKWKNHKAKFKGLVYGSDTGIFVDTRNPYEK